MSHIPPLGPILSQVNPLNTLTPYSLQIYFYIILPPRPLRFYEKTFVCISLLPLRATCLANVNLLAFAALIFGEE